MYMDTEWTLRHSRRAAECAWFQLCFSTSNKTTYFKLSYLYVHEQKKIWKYNTSRLVGTFTLIAGIVP